MVKELRLKNISSVEEANLYLKEFILEYNNKFGKAPLSNHDMHRSLSPHMNLNSILCYKTERTVLNSLTFQHNRQLFLLEDNLETRTLRRKQIMLCEYLEGEIKVFYQGKELQYNILYDRVDPLPQGAIITNNKYLAEVLEYAQARQL